MVRKASLVAQLVKNLPAMRETWVWSLGWENPLEKGKATHSSILAWRIPWTVHGVAKSWTRLSDFHFTSLHFTTVRNIEMPKVSQATKGRINYPFRYVWSCFPGMPKFLFCLFLLQTFSCVFSLVLCWAWSLHSKSCISETAAAPRKLIKGGLQLPLLTSTSRF